MMMLCAFNVLLVAVFASCQLVSAVMMAESHPVINRARRQSFYQPAHYEQIGSGCINACRNAGYNGQCCDITQTSCFQSLCNCYCDFSCHLYDDCCDDINQIGCSSSGQGNCDMLTLDNGNVMYHPNAQSTAIGTIAVHSCNAGYALVGSSIRVCQDNAQWSNTAPVCREVCNEQLSLDNGVITYKPDNNLSTKPARTVAFLSCNEGYTLAGSARRVCQGSEGWTGLQPICYSTSCRVAYPGTGCTTNPNDPLLGPGGSNPRQCSCHISCFTDDDVDCCEDIGCVPTMCAEVIQGSPGCCDWDIDREYNGSCYIQTSQSSGCYCDSACRDANDCCSDVPTPEQMPTLNCPSSGAAGSQRVQSVRMRPFSHMQVASRYQGRRPSGAFIRDQIEKELAQLEEKRHRWETIAKELENNQKNF